MKNHNLWLQGVCFFISFTIGCSTTTPPGPSDEKLQLDFEDKIRYRIPSAHLLHLDVFNIVKRESLSEDRIKYHITARFALDKNEMEQAQIAQERDRKMFGPVSGFGSN